MLFLIGAVYPVEFVYLMLLIYLLMRMLQRDAWLFHFLGISAAFVIFFIWVMSERIIDHDLMARLLMAGGIVYSFLSVVIAKAMSSNSKGPG